MARTPSRRRFLESALGAASAAGLALPLKLAAAPLVADPDHRPTLERPERPLRLGIIGIGGRGSGLLRTFLQTRQVEVVALCDIDSEAIQRGQAIAQGMTPKVYEDYRELLADGAVEAVITATPVDLHHEMGIRTVRAGKHNYFEKPMGLSAREAEELYQAAAKADVVFQVGFQWVYNAAFRAAIEAVHEGLIGDVRFVHAQRHGAGDLPHKPWLMDRRRSGDIIVEQAVHEMNVFCWGLKGHPERAAGFGGINCLIDSPPGRSVMDHYALTMEFPNETRVCYSHMFYATAPLDGMHIYFFGTRGAVDVMKGEIYLKSAPPPAPRPMRLSGDDTFNAALDFIEKVRRRQPPEADALKGLLATKAAVLGRTALYKGKPVLWKHIA